MSRSSVFTQLPPAGLANRLIVWSKGCVAAEQLGVPHYVHGWGRIPIGPWLRSEKSKRIYGTQVKAQQSRFQLVLESAACRFLGRTLVVDPDFTDLPLAKENTTYLFRSMGEKTDLFRGLRGNSSMLRQKLHEILRPRVRKLAMQLAPLEIAVHVRRGDFITAGWKLSSEEYFIEAIAAIRKRRGTQTVRVFTDAPAESLPGLSKIENLTFHESQGDVLDLIQISLATTIVTSLNSTFGYLPAFLSDAEVILDPRHSLGKITNGDRFEGTLENYKDLEIEATR